NLLVIAWNDAPKVEHIQQFSRIALRIGKSYPRSTGLLNLVLSGTPSFDDAMRRETKRVASDPAVCPLGAADVVLVGGLVGAAVRAFLNTTKLLARPPRPTRAFSDLDAAAPWLA